jgi:hypothetical protein
MTNLVKTTDTNKTDTDRQSHKTGEACPIFMGMTNLVKTTGTNKTDCVVFIKQAQPAGEAC